MNFEMTPERKKLAFNILLDAITFRALVEKKNREGLVDNDCVTVIAHFTEGLSVFISVIENNKNMSISDNVLIKKTSDILAKEISYVFDKMGYEENDIISATDRVLISLLSSKLSLFFNGFETWFINEFIPSLTPEELLIAIDAIISDINQ